MQFNNEEDVIKLAERSVSLKMCIELWAYANTTSKLHDIMRNYQQSFYKPYFTPDKSFKIQVETYCKHYTQREKVQKIEVRIYIINF